MNFIGLDLLVKSRKWQRPDVTVFANQTHILRVLYEAWRSVGVGRNSTDLSLSISLVDDRSIRKINAEYRGQDEATNVLSFPTFDGEFFDVLGVLPLVEMGDIFISFSTMEREAAEQDKTLRDHFDHMLVHSFLHLMGYDHLDKNARSRMEGLEISILSDMGIENPYD